MWPMRSYEELTRRELEDLALDRRLSGPFESRMAIIRQLRRDDRLRLTLGFVSGLLVVGILTGLYSLGLQAF